VLLFPNPDSFSIVISECFYRKSRKGLRLDSHLKRVGNDSKVVKDAIRPRTDEGTRFFTLSFPKASIGNPEKSEMRWGRTYYVYLLASRRNGTLYIGVTNDLVRRIYEHKEKLFKGFTSKYDVSMLVYYEIHNDVSEAIRREKQLKKWNRAWKLRLIEKHNSKWRNLYKDGEILSLPVELM
jgi:putative endonuclease